MKGYRFYREYVHKGKDTDIPKDTGLAVFVDTRRIDLNYVNDPFYVFDCASYLTDHRASGVCMTSCDEGYLHDKCRRVTEAKARVLFPELFTYLES